MRVAVQQCSTYSAEHISQLLQGLASSTFRGPSVAKVAQAICNRSDKLTMFGDEQCLVVTLHSLGQSHLRLHEVGLCG